MQNWDRLDPATQGALTSLGYNYGGSVPPRGKADYMKPLRDAVASGDKTQIAAAVRAMQGHNGGVNRQRRLEEASIIETGHLPASWHARDPAAKAVAGGVPKTAAPMPTRIGPVPGAQAPVSVRSQPGATTTWEDRATRSTAPERQAARTSLRPLSPRFTDPGLRSAYDARPGAAGMAGAAPGRGGAHGGNITVTQHFHGQHDPRETARHAKREANREIGRAKGRALRGIGALS